MVAVLCGFFCFLCFISGGDEGGFDAGTCFSEDLPNISGSESSVSSLKGGSGGQAYARNILVRLVVHLLVCKGWCFLIPMWVCCSSSGVGR